jgi:hypothetical protein
MSCGLPLAGKRVETPRGYQQPAYQPVPAYGPPVAKNKWLVPALVGALLLLLCLGGAAFLMSAAKPAGPPLTARASAGPVPLTVGKPTMPQDVYDWLDHLRQTEDKKNELSKDQESKLMIELTKLQGLGGAYGSVDEKGTLDPDKLENPSTTLANRLGDLRAPWRELIKFFESVPPPQECADLAHSYDQALDEVSGEMGDLGDILGGGGENYNPTDTVAKLEKMEGQSTGTIDKYFSVSDDMVSNICNKYNTRKWFKIQADVTSPLSAGMGNFTMPPIKSDSLSQ